MITMILLKDYSFIAFSSPQEGIDCIVDKGKASISFDMNQNLYSFFFEAPLSSKLVV
jgi:hypothetical protein